uniref:Methyltransf_21 domain-containing protein n=1 Tax=Panagrellus redivivus TaxID=6233 RepID=A0A7E4ZRJ0_PANRE
MLPQFRGIASTLRRVIIIVALAYSCYNIVLYFVNTEPKETTLADVVFDCLAEKFKNGNTFEAAFTWIFLSEVVQTCSAPANKTVIPELFFGEEQKYFIPAMTPNFEYTLLTLGVGHNIEAEKKILRKYKNCKSFVGVDPTSEINENLVVKEGGKFLQRTVGAKDEVAEAYLMNRQGNDSNWFNMTYTSLQNIITQAGMEDHVDLMLMDIEGAEFEILERFIDNPKKHTPICQLNVEIHSPWNNGVQKDEIVQTLFKLNEKREYLLYVADGIQVKKQVFNRCFFINVKDPYCIDKYYPALKNRVTAA